MGHPDAQSSMMSPKSWGGQIFPASSAAPVDMGRDTMRFGGPRARQRTKEEEPRLGGSQGIFHT